MRVIGLISGTSADGIDGVLTTIAGSGYDLTVEVIGGKTVPYPTDLRQQILELGSGTAFPIAALADLETAIAQAFATAAQHLIDQYGPVDLIASHGQTVFHRPPAAATAHTTTRAGFSWQMGRGEAIAQRTQCLTISNFRQADMLVGGEGAPLVPPVDLALLSHPTLTRCVQNIGGIGNVALLPPWSKQTAPPLKVVGWDTGPGNSLIDLAVSYFTDGEQTYDRDGAWAAQGQPHVELVSRWLEHPYFEQLPPKSTGRELFGQAFVEQCLNDTTALALSPADVLATLTEFTAQSIADSYSRFLAALPDEVLLCGGGSHNPYLIERLRIHLPGVSVCTTTDVGVSADLKEAIAFAVLGYWRYHQFPGNLPSVTGARQSVLLGDMHAPL